MTTSRRGWKAAGGRFAGLALVVVLTLGFVWKGSSGLPKPRRADQVSAAQAALLAPVREPTENPSKSAPLPNIVLQGVILNPQGKAVAGARVYRFNPDQPAARAVEPNAITDAEGRFAFVSPISAPPSGASGPFDNPPVRSIFLAAVAPGYGVGIEEFWLPLASKTIRLARDDRPIRGQVVDSQDHPVAGARVRILSLLARRPDRSSVSSWLNSIRKFGSDPGISEGESRPDFLPPLGGAHAAAVIPSPIVADAAGRFTIAGVGRDRILTALIEGPGIATQYVILATEPLDSPIIFGDPYLQEAYIERLGRRDHRSAFESEVFIYGSNLIHRAKPGRSLAGVVRDPDSGRPLAGVVVQLDDHMARFSSAILIRTTSGGDGKYLLAGLSEDSVAEVSAHPDSESLWLGISRKVAIAPRPGTTAPVNLDFALKRGVRVHGRVTDEATGQPQRALVQTWIYADNPAFHQDDPDTHPLRTEFWTAQDGRFRLLVYPMPGLISATSRDRNDVLGVGFEEITGPRRREAPDSLDTLPHSLSRRSITTVVAIDPPPRSGPITVSLPIRAGLERTGTLRDEAGQPVSSGVAAYNLELGQTASLASEQFVVKGLARTESRCVIFRQDSRKRIASLEVVESEGPPLVATLRAWGSIKFEVVETVTGAGDAGHLEMHLTGHPRHRLFGNVSLAGSTPDRLTTVAPGRFEVTALAPGLGYDIHFWSSKTGRFQRVASGVRVEPGQTLDLGTFRMDGSR